VYLAQAGRTRQAREPTKAGASEPALVATQTFAHWVRRAATRSPSSRDQEGDTVYQWTDEAASRHAADREQLVVPRNDPKRAAGAMKNLTDLFIRRPGWRP